MTVRTEQCTFQVEEDFAEILRDLVEAGFENAGFEEVKSSAVRRVLCGSLRDGTRGHVKLFRAVRFSDRARDAVGGSRGPREFRVLGEARERGLPCVRPIAAGRFSGSFGTRSFLVTETIANAEPLPRGPLDAGAAAKVGALLRRAHDAGLAAPDLHPGNIVRSSDGALFLLDLTNARFLTPLERDERLHALAFFCLDLDGGAADRAARPLVDAYGLEREAVERAARMGRRLRHRALSAFGRRHGRACRHTLVERNSEAGERWFWHRSGTAEPLRDEARAWIAHESEQRPAKSGRRGAVFVGDRLVVKTRTAAAARRLFQSAYWLLFARVPCAEPVALRLRAGRGQVFSRRIQNQDLATELRDGTVSDERLRACARRLGTALGRMHALGIRNRDLKLENLVRDPDGDDPMIVDLDGVRRRPAIEVRGQAADLGRLLAAYRAAVAHVDPIVVRSFLRGYHRARRDLGMPAGRYLFRHSAGRAKEWDAAHPRAGARNGPGSRR